MTQRERAHPGGGLLAGLVVLAVGLLVLAVTA